MKEVNNFVWFESYTKAIEKIDDVVARSMLSLAIVEYGSLGKEPKFIDTKKTQSCFLEAIFEALRPNIDESVKRYTNGKKGASSGKKGGRPKKGETKEEAYIRRNGELIEPANLPYSGLDLEVDSMGNFI